MSVFHLPTSIPLSLFPSLVTHSFVPPSLLPLLPPSLPSPSHRHPSFLPLPFHPPTSVTSPDSVEGRRGQTNKSPSPSSSAGDQIIPPDQSCHKSFHRASKAAGEIYWLSLRAVAPCSSQMSNVQSLSGHSSCKKSITSDTGFESPPRWRASLGKRNGVWSARQQAGVAEWMLLMVVLKNPEQNCSQSGRQRRKLDWQGVVAQQRQKYVRNWHPRTRVATSHSQFHLIKINCPIVFLGCHGICWLNETCFYRILNTVVFTYPNYFVYNIYTRNIFLLTWYIHDTACKESNGVQEQHCTGL